MPIYEYECTHCQHRFELRQGFHDKPQAECPLCNRKARRVFHPTPIIFKGSGFYVTDHRKSDGTSKRKEGTDSKSKQSPDSTKTKPEAKKSKD